MGLRDLLSLPRKLCRTRSLARSVTGAIENWRKAGLGALPPHSKSVPNIGSSIWPTSVPLTPRTLGFNENVVSDPTKSATEEGKQSKFRDHIFGQSTTTNEGKPGSSWKSTAYTSAKSVMGGLIAVLKHYDQKTAIYQTIISLIPRVEKLVESLRATVPEGEVWEQERREALKRKLENILRELEPLVDQGKIAGFFSNVKNSDTLSSLAEDVRDALMEYQEFL